MDSLAQTDYYDPSTLARQPKLEISRFNQILSQSLIQQDQSFRHQQYKPAHVNNMTFKRNIKEQPTDNESNQQENLTNQNCDQALTRRIDQNTELKIYLKNRSIYITVIQAAPDQMSDILNEQIDSSKRNNINIYKGKVKSMKMDGYMKGLFYDVMSLFVHLKLTDQIEFNVVKNEKKIITLLDNSDEQQNKFQNQEYFQYFLNFYMNQVLPGERMVKRSCSINLRKIDTEPKHIKQIKESRWKKQAQKIDELSAKITQLEEKLIVQQEKVKKYKLKNEKLRGYIKYIRDQSYCVSKQKDRNIEVLDEQDVYYNQELEKKFRVLEKRKRKEKQQNCPLSKRQILSISIDSTPQKRVKQQPGIQAVKPKQEQKQSIKQNTFSSESQFIIRVQNLNKKNSRQKHTKPQTTLQKKNLKRMQEKKAEQINHNSIISSSKTKQTQNSNNSSSGQRTIQKLNSIFRNLQPSEQKNLTDKQLSSQQKKTQSTNKLGLINKYIPSKDTPRKIQITGDSYLKISKQVQLISVPCAFLIVRFQESFPLDFRNKIMKHDTVIIIQFSVNSIICLVRDSNQIFMIVFSLAQSIKNNKNITQFIKMLTIEHSHSCVFSGEFQPMVNLINNHLLNLSKVIVKYPSGKKSVNKKNHWTGFLRKEIQVRLLRSHK